MIRTAIREEQEHYRHRNVAKLLFMHMLGMFLLYSGLNRDSLLYPPGATVESNAFAYHRAVFSSNDSMD